MISKTRQRISWASKLFLLITLLWGLTGIISLVSAQEKVTFKYMFWTPMYQPYYEKAFKVFEEEHPNIKIELRSAPYGEYWHKMQALLAAGNPPEVYEMSIAYVEQFAKAGGLMDLQPFVDRDLNIKDYYAGVLNQLRFFPKKEGHLYAFPYQWVASVLFYNKDLFDKEGLSYPNDNWDYNKLLDVAKKLSKDTNGDGKIDQWGFYSNTSHTFLDSLIKAYGGKVINEKYTKAMLTDPVAIEAIKFAVNMIQKYKVAPPQPTYEALLASGGEMFRTGRVAMTIDGSYMMDSFKAAPFSWDISMVPKGPKKRVIYGGPDSVVISANAKHPQEAWEVVKFITTRRPLDTYVLGGVPVIKKITQSKEWRSRYSFLKHLDSLLKSQEYMEGADFGPGWFEWRISVMNSELTPAFLGQKSVEAAAKDATEAINEVLARYH
ncbi:sugar ABC transporter substrate-binding protein [Candidatus Aerophobetes bacterium]|nr:sugar ABC transporter substrate-binding protein [Candidatus Aerophobetes bacterium]